MKESSNTSNTRQALWIGLGSLASFGFSIVSSMILSRYFNKEDYGTYKQVMYVYNSLLVVFTLGLPQAFGYFLPRVPKDQGRSVVNMITKVLLILGSVFMIILAVCRNVIADVLRNPNLSEALLIFCPVPFLLLPTIGIDSIYSTYRRTLIAALYNLSTRLILLICVCTPVLFYDATYKGALYGFVLASLLNFIIAIYLKNRPFKGYKRDKSPYGYKDLFKFSIPLLVASLWGLVINSSDQFFISRYFGTEVFAEFSNGAMELPFVGMVISACSTVLYPLFSRYHNEGVDAKKVIYPVWQSVFKKTAMIIYPMVVFCWFFADQIMGLLYGAKYECSGTYFQIKLFANLFTLVAYAPVILSIGKTKYYAAVHMWGAIILVISEFIVVNTIYSPYAVTIVSVICQIGRIMAMLYIVAKYFRVSMIDLFPLILIAKIVIPSAIFLWLVNILFSVHSNIMDITICLCAYIIFMIIIDQLMKFNYLSLIKSIIKKQN